MSVDVLSRIQFALTISFHFVFPPLTIGLGLVLVVIQALRVWTKNPVYYELARFWTRVFGLIFAIGVATGIPMEFQFGTNWAHYARFVGDIFGSPLAIEGIYAFFLESGFLALLLFGWNKIGPRMHLFSTAMVSLGAHFSAIWIIVANSWMQTPAGYHLTRRMPDGKEVPLPQDYVVQASDLPYVRAVVHDFSEAILNPSTIDRLTHTIFACWMTGAFLVVGISAWWLLRGRHVAAAKASLKIGLAVAAVACCLQMIAADSTARGVSKNQPVKFAALEGLMKTQKEAGLGIVGVATWKRDAEGNIIGVDETALRMPGMLSILVSGDFLHPIKASETEVKGLEQLPSNEFLRHRHPGASDAELAKIRPNYWPNVPALFQTYHLMVGLGMTLTGLALLGCFFWKTGRLWRPESRLTRNFLRLLVLTPFMCEVATQAGWFTAELGRQPWIVYEVMKTSEAASVVLSPDQVVRSILMFLMIYLLLTVLSLMLLGRLIRKGPESGERETLLVKMDEPISLKAGRQTEG